MKLYLNMKRIPIIALGAALLLAACTPGGGPITLESRQFSDATEHAELKFDVELPLPENKAAAEIRRQLVGVMDEALSHIDNYEEARAFPAFTGDVNDTEALFSYYESQALESIGAVSDAEANERAEAILEAEDITEEEKQQYLSHMPGWGYEFSLKKTEETDKYVVFDSQNYIYRGGAHGGIIGAGPQTFSKKDGSVRKGAEWAVEENVLQGLMTAAQEKAAEILDALLTKYANSGLTDLENVDVLKVDPLKKYGTQVYIINTIFGGIAKYRQAIKELETAIYTE